MATLLKPISALEHPANVDFEVTTCFIEYRGKYLVLQRGRKDAQYGLWGIPGGKLEEGENLLSALNREIFEETGIYMMKKRRILFIKITPKQKRRNEKSNEKLFHKKKYE